MADSTAKLIMDFINTQMATAIDLIDKCYWGETNVTNEAVSVWVESEIQDIMIPDPNNIGVNTEQNEEWVLNFVVHSHSHDETCQAVESMQRLWQKQGNALLVALQALKPNDNDIINMTWGGKVYPGNIKSKSGYTGIVQFKIEVRFYYPA